jgi:hypothetical protein
MNGALNVKAASKWVRRHVHSGVVNADSTPDILIISPLDIF